MSFLEKFKRNIGIEEPAAVKTKTKTRKKIKVEESISDKTSALPASAPDKSGASAGKEKWFEKKGELAVDVYQTDDYLVIQSAVAGVKPENLDIFIENDILIIEGNREKPVDEEKNKNYYYQECYWGPFHRRVILQEEVDNSRAEAIMKEGILTIKIPKIERKKKRKILVKEGN